MKNHQLTEFFVPASKPSKSLGNTIDFVTERKICTNWDDIEHNGWHMISTKPKHDWCGMWQTVGCLNSATHQMLGKGKRVYLKQYVRSCYRPSCTECYPKWIARQANRSTRRIEAFGEKSKRMPIHLLLSVSQSQYGTSYDILKKRAREILKTIEFEGASIIFHPFRFHKSARTWYYSPHFHLVGYGWRTQIHKGYGKFGWYVKDLGIRQSVFQTYCYLLSHCGIKKRVHAVLWVGSLSYSKLRVEKEPLITCCPICGGDFMPIYYDGIHPVVPPDEYYQGLVDDCGGWYPVKTIDHTLYSECSYEYHPIRHVNDVLESLCLAK